jgi:hypothetical protein
MNLSHGDYYGYSLSLIRQERHNYTRYAYQKFLAPELHKLLRSRVLTTYLRGLSSFEQGVIFCSG